MLRSINLLLMDSTLLKLKKESKDSQSDGSPLSLDTHSKDSVNLDSMKSSRTSIRELLEKRMQINIKLLDGQFLQHALRLLLTLYSAHSKQSKSECKLTVLEHSQETLVKLGS